MKTSELLIAAKAVISKPETWTQGTYARKSVGEGQIGLGASIQPYHPSAVCFCSIGALRKVACEADPDRFSLSSKVLVRAEEFLDIFSVKRGSLCIANFNDHNSHEQVLNVFDDAIELAKEKENETV